MYLLVDLPALPILYTDVEAPPEAAYSEVSGGYDRLLAALRASGLSPAAAPLASALPRGALSSEALSSGGKGARLRLAMPYRAGTGRRPRPAGTADGGEGDALPDGVRESLPDGVRAGARPPMRAAHLVRRGEIGGLGTGHERLQAAVEADGRAAGGPPWIALLTDPGTTAPARLETAVYLPLA